MTTKRDLDLFRKHLRTLTKEGNPGIMGTPFVILRIFNPGRSKPFYGVIGNSKFAITLNNIFFSSPYTIEGDFKNNNSKKGINYKIKPIWFGYLWVRIMPLIFITLLGIVFFQIEDQFDGYDWDIFLSFFVFMAIFTFLPLYLTIEGKVSMGKKFLKEFNSIHS